MDAILLLLTSRLESIIYWILVLFAVYEIFYFKKKSALTKQVVAFINMAESLTTTGSEKFEWVVERLLSSVPTIFKPFLTKDKISAIVQYVYNNCKKYASQKNKIQDE